MYTLIPHVASACLPPPLPPSFSQAATQAGSNKMFVLSTYLKTLNKCFVNVCLLKSLMCTARKTQSKKKANNTVFKSNTIFQVLLHTNTLYSCFCDCLAVRLKLQKLFQHTYESARKCVCVCVCVRV